MLKENLKNRARTLYLDKDYKPCPAIEDDEIFRNGIFHFNITKMMEDIQTGKLIVDRERINIEEWFKSHWHSDSLNEEHLPTVDIDSTIIQAEISPGVFSIIDGNHRIEKAFHLGKASIDSFKLMGEQLIPYFISVQGYEAYVDYWNSKLVEKQ